MNLISKLGNRLRRNRWKRPTTDASKAQVKRDKLGLPAIDPGPELAIREGIAWLYQAQDNSVSRDGGVARDFSLEKGWATSYPETTGYIIPTLLEYYRRFNAPEARVRAIRMLDWFVAIQMPGGGFQGGRIDSTPVVPVTFNTGQILIGLSAGVADLGERYRPAMEGAARWLVESLDPDGCWRKFPTPFAAPGEKAYETHVAWGLFEAERLSPGKGFGDAGLRNVAWALTKQRDNGWFADNCLSDPLHPLTHTIGYVLRGVIEGYRLSGDRTLLDASCRAADGVLGAIRQDGFLPGRLDARWSPAATWVCLTGSVQIAHCLLLLFQATGNPAYRDKAYALNSFVRRTIDVSGPSEVRGAVKGSFPIDGDYGTFEYLNWAAKFMIDANLIELDVREA